MKQDDLTQIIEDCRFLGVRAGGVLLVHASLSAMGKVKGGAETVIRALKEVLGPEGTLAFPSLSYDFVTPENPVFSIDGTPSNVGVIPEHFRKRPGSMRSLHPTHSVCATGPLAKELLLSHGLDNTPCGTNSPFRKLRELNGQILMLGCGLRPNTSMHAIEELVIPPYLLGEVLDYQLILSDGRKISKRYVPHNFDGWTQRYDRVADVLNKDELVNGEILKANVYLIEVEVMWKKVLNALQKNPFYFVDSIQPIL